MNATIKNNKAVMDTMKKNVVEIVATIKKYKALKAAEVVELEMVRGGYAPEARYNLRKASIIKGLVRLVETTNDSIAISAAAIEAEELRIEAVEAVEAEETTVLNGKTINIDDYLRSIGC